MTQLYLIKMLRMSTTTEDEVDVVPEASFVCSEDELKELDLVMVGQGLGDVVKDFPETLRPMNRDEIDAWRCENK